MTNWTNDYLIPGIEPYHVEDGGMMNDSDKAIVNLGEFGAWSFSKTEKVTEELMTYKEALQAIVARYNGDWDNLSLIKVGPLSTDTEEDMVRIARDALDGYVYGETPNIQG
jgi:hypothetical protein